MKRFLCAILTAFVACGACAANAATSAEDVFDSFEPAKVSFSDMEDYPWAKEAVDYLTAHGAVSGVGNSIFDPKRNVTRLEFIKMICLALCVIDEDAVSAYADVPADHWGYTYASSAKEIGLLDIYDAGSLGANVFITREDMAYITAEALGLDNAARGEKFTDDDDIASYAENAVYSLRDLGIINGRGGGVFDPKGNASRAEAAKIVYGAALEMSNNYLD